MRYAIYYTPENASALNQLGSAWLGRNAFSDEAVVQPDPRLWNITVSARRYGLHGTLKPPFRLKDGTSAATLAASVRRIATQHKTFLTPPLVLASLDGFLALQPDGPCPDLDQVAGDCVQQLDDFRAPASEEELRRRRAHGLTSAQEDLLQRWGYPFVFEEFRFHITLTDRLTDADRDWIMPMAEAHFAPVLGQPLLFDGLTISHEAGDGMNLRVIERFPLIRNAEKAA